MYIARHTSALQALFLGPWATIWKDSAFTFSLIRREIEGRYRGAYGGLLWYIVNNLLLLGIYSFVFGTIFKARWSAAGATDAHFAVPLFIGLIVFNVYAECISRAPVTITANPSYVKRVVFPLEILPVVNLGVALFNFAVGLAVMVCLAGLLGTSIHWEVVWMPVLLAPVVFLVLGLSWVLASLGVYVRDVTHLVGFLVISTMFLSPIFFPGTAFPEKYQWMMHLNPMTYPIEAARAAALNGQAPDLGLLLVYTGLGLVVAHAGFTWFQLTRRGFADVL